MHLGVRELLFPYTLVSPPLPCGSTQSTINSLSGASPNVSKLVWQGQTGGLAVDEHLPSLTTPGGLQSSPHYTVTLCYIPFTVSHFSTEYSETQKANKHSLMEVIGEKIGIKIQ